MIKRLQIPSFPRPSPKRLVSPDFPSERPARGAPGPVRFFCISLSFLGGGLGPILAWALGLFHVPLPKPPPPPVLVICVWSALGPVRFLCAFALGLPGTWPSLAQALGSVPCDLGQTTKTTENRESRNQS